jgi:hypothetical protein
MRGAFVEKRMKTIASRVREKVTVASTCPTVTGDYPCLQTLDLLLELKWSDGKRTPDDGLIVKIWERTSRA